MAVGQCRGDSLAKTLPVWNRGRDEARRSGAPVILGAQSIESERVRLDGREQFHRPIGSEHRTAVQDPVQSRLVDETT